MSSTPVNNDRVTTRRTTANLAAYPYRLVKASGAADTALCGAGELPIGATGVDAGASTTDAHWIEVHEGDEMVVTAGAAITAPALVMSDANGKVVAATANKFAIGQVKNDVAADGDLCVVIKGIGWYEA